MPAFDQIQAQIIAYQEAGKTMFVSSSFQTHSIPLLHMISRIDNSIPVYFLNTGYHFPDTIVYKDMIADLLRLNVRNISSATPRIMQMNDQGNFLYTSDPDYCCYLNKIAPMEPLLDQYDIWINGVRGDQNSNRAGFQIEQATHRNALRYHPIIDWTNRDIYKYIADFGLPPHPLDNKGYISIGCEPCTRKFDLEMLQDERAGRWFGMNKTECGLHTDLIEAK
jgi:phosphoadenosine phosphosulfate reductase